MAGIVRSRPSNVAPGAPVPGHLEGRYRLLASTALGSGVVGLLLFLDATGRFGELVPLLLLVVGVSLLLISALVLRREVLSTNPQHVPSRPAAATPVPPIDPDHELESQPVGRLPVATRFGSTADWRVPSVASVPGEGAWLSWLPHGLRRPGEEERSLVPGVVTSPGRAGTLVAFPVPNYYGVVAPASRPPPLTQPRSEGAAGGRRPPPLRSDSSIREVRASPRGPAAPLDRAAPFSEEELDQMFPPAADARSPFLRDAPDRIGVPRGPGLRASPNAMPDPVELDDFDSFERAVEADAMDSEFPAHPGGTEESPPELPTGSSPAPASRRGEDAARSPRRDAFPDLRTEAANPVPPHLRAVGPLLRFEAEPSRERSKRGPSPRSVCASCSKVVLNLRMSGPCPKCMRPLCNDCLREAFVTRGRGWCADCSLVSATAS